MYEDIRKPRLLRNIPLLLIRPLPILYYYSRYFKKKAPDTLQEIHQTHLHYLTAAVELLNHHTHLAELPEVVAELSRLGDVPDEKRSLLLQQIVLKLSRICGKYREDIGQAARALRSRWVEMYRETTRKIRVLAVDNNNEPERTEKLRHTLQNFCLYPCDQCPLISKELPQKMLKTDFVLLTSTFPTRIHSQVEWLRDYRKPGLALATIGIESQPDKQSIRHGAQLQRIGFPVIYKTFTPIRLFTSIDKTYVQYHLRS